MKLLYSILPISLIALIFIGFSNKYETDLDPSYFINKVKEQKNLKANELIQSRKNTNQFTVVKTFSLDNKPNQNALREFAKSATFLKLNINNLKNLLSAGLSDISFSIPVDSKKSFE